MQAVKRGSDLVVSEVDLKGLGDSSTYFSIKEINFFQMALKMIQTALKRIAVLNFN